MRRTDKELLRDVSDRSILSPSSGTRAITNGVDNFIVATILVFLICLIAYSPSMLIPSAHHDQYRYFMSADGNCANDGALRYLFLIGRPLGAIMECVSYRIARTIPDVSWVRLLTVAILAVTGGVFAVILRNFGLSLASGLLLGAGAMLLPGSLSVVFQAVTNDIAAALIGLAAFVCLPLDVHSRSYRQLAVSYLTVVLILLAGNLTYPASTPLFFVPLLMLVLLRPTADIGKLRIGLIGAVAAFGIASIIYFVISKYYLATFALQFGFNGTGGYAFKPDFAHLLAKVDTLSTDILARMLNGWNIYPLRAITIGSSIVIIVGTIAAEVSSARITGWHYRAIFEKYCAVIGLLFSSAVVWVASPVSFFLNRLFLAFGIMIYLLFAVSLWVLVRAALERIVPRWDSMVVMAGLLAGIGVGVTAFNATTQALHDRDEFVFVKTQLAQPELKDIKRIHIIRPPNSFGFGYNGMRESGVDEFNVRILEYEPKVAPIVSAALGELTGDFTLVRSGKIEVTSSLRGEPMPIKEPGDGMVIIDMGILAKANGAPY